MDTKSFIIETAFKHFLSKGYKNTSMANLVEATGLSKGAFYYYFKSKELIYNQVIDYYFLSYYDKIDWKTAEHANIYEIEIMIKKFYKSLIPEIHSITQKGLSRYFMMFFEAYELYPQFKNKIRIIYKKLQLVLANALKNEGIQNHEKEAIKIITKYEGFIFWGSVFPEESIDKLIDEL